MGCDSGLPGTSVIVDATCDANDLSPEEFVNCLFNGQQQYANDRTEDAIAYAGAAVCSAKGADLSISRDDVKYQMTAEEPDIPDEFDSAISTWTNLQNTMLPLFGQTFDDYFNKAHTAIYNPAYQAAAARLVDIIANGDSGIPDHIEQQIYGRSTDRIRAEAAIARNAAINRGSALGWDMPQPFAIAQGEAAELAAYGALGSASVKISEKQIDIQIESSRFAVSEANKIYLGMEQNAIDYLQAWTALLNNIKDMAEIDPNVKANYTNAVANLYGKRIQKDQVQWMSLNDFYQRGFGDNQLKSSNVLTQTDLVVKATTSAAEVMKMMAAAVLSQMSTMVTKVATS